MNSSFFNFLLLSAFTANISAFGETFTVCANNSSPCLLQEPYLKDRNMLQNASHEVQNKIKITAESIDLIKNDLNALFELFKQEVKNSPLKNLHMGYNVIAFLETIKQYALEYQLTIPDNFLTIKIGDTEYNLNNNSVYESVAEKLGFHGEIKEIKKKLLKCRKYIVIS